MGWLTGDTVPSADFVCARLVIPNDLALIIAVYGALDELTEYWNWEQFGLVTPDEAAQAMATMWDIAAQDAPCMIGSILLYARATAPAGTLLCDGTIYNRVDYPALYAVLAPQFIIDANTFITPSPPSYDDLNYYIVAI